MQTAFNFSQPRKRYPSVAGSKVSGPSQEAARSVDAATLRTMVLGSLRLCGPLTADECAGWLDIDRLSVRPRFSELKRLGKIEDSGQRRKNQSGKSATVWRLR